MNDRQCCDGLCNQGRECPRFATPAPREHLSMQRVYGWGALYACCLAVIAVGWWLTATYGPSAMSAVLAWLGVA